MEKTYRYNFNQRPTASFFTFIKEWELDFHVCFAPLYANHIFANNNAMSILERQSNFGSKYKFGQELIDGKIDTETNLKIENHSRYKTIYAIGSMIPGRKDEPVFLIIDPSVRNGSAVLKYIDNDNGNSSVPQVPIDQKVKVKF